MSREVTVQKKDPPLELRVPCSSSSSNIESVMSAGLRNGLRRLIELVEDWFKWRNGDI